MKKTLLSLFLIFPLMRCGPNCGTGNVLPYYDLQGVDVHTSQVVRIDQGPGVTKLAVESLAAGQPVAADNLLLSATGTVRFHAGLRQPCRGSAWEAYACSPAPSGQAGSKESVKELTVRSEQDFDATHPAGSSLNEYFEYVAVDEYRTEYQPVENLADYTKKFPLMVPQNFALRLRQSPAQKAGSYTFTLHYELTNGEMYMARTGNVTFK